MPRTKPVLMRSFIWETAADMMAQKILTGEMVGKVIVPTLITLWPELIYSMLKHSSINFSYTLKEFKNMSYERQKQLAGDRYSVDAFRKEVDRRYNIFKLGYNKAKAQQISA